MSKRKKERFAIVPSDKGLGCPDTTAVYAFFCLALNCSVDIAQPGTDLAQKLWAATGVPKEDRKHPLVVFRYRWKGEEVSIGNFLMEPTQEDLRSALHQAEYDVLDLAPQVMRLRIRRKGIAPEENQFDTLYKGE